MKNATRKKNKERAKSKENANILVDKWIDMLLKAGYDYEGMVKVFQMARVKLDLLKDEK